MSGESPPPAPDLEGLLRAHDLAGLVEVFLEHGIEVDVFRDLTEEDLREMGLSLGDRKRVLRVQRALTAPAAIEVPEAVEEPRASAERRQITVLFADLVGSTALSVRLDPEDLRAVLTRYNEVIERCVARYGGHVAKYMGDGAMVYFGWPRAHENDAERAIRAALDIVTEVARIEADAGVWLESRVGIATGPVVIGDLVEAADYRERSVVGTTPNLAARLESVADPGAVVISDTTRRVVGSLFDLTDLGPTEVKGWDRDLRVWRVDGESRLPSRFAALRGARISPLVGREMEMAILREAVARTQAGHLNVVHLIGEAGIGKSRLARWLRDELAARGWLEQVYSCSPYHSSSSFHPLIRHLEATADIRPQDPPEVGWSRLAQVVDDGGLSRNTDLPILAKLLGIPLPDDVAAPRLEPIQEKEGLLMAAVNRIGHRAGSAPVLVVVEDLHWGDPSTNELLGRLMAGLPESPVLVLLSYRPGVEAPWPTDGHVRLELGRLTTENAQEIVAELCRDAEIDPAMIRKIVDRTDGVPLFVEELTKTILEARSAGESTDGSFDPASIPETLHDSLLARLDRQGEAKGVAQVAACIGREFAPELVRVVAGVSEQKVDDALERLLESHLIQVDRGGGRALYSFRHALVQEAAYRSLLKATRVELHGRIAAALERGTLEVAPEIMAHHHGRAGDASREADYWLQAGQSALGSTAYAEAIQHFTAGLDALSRLPDFQPARELTFQVLRAVPLTLTQGWASEQVGEAYRRAHALCEILGGSAETFPTLVGIFTYHLVRGEFAYAYELGQSNEQVAREAAQDDLLIEALHDRGTSSLYRGRFDEASGYLQQTWEMYDPELHAHHKFLYNKLPGPTAAVHLMMALAVRGRGDEVATLYREALDLAERGDHAFTRVWVRTGYCIALIHQEDVEALNGVAQAIIEESRELGFPNWLAQGLVWAGWSVAEGGQPENGLSLVRQGLEIWSMTGARLMVPYLTSRLSAVLLQMNELEEAERSYLSTRELMDETGEYWCAAEVHRLGAEVARRREGPDAPAARERTDLALTLARAQGAHLYELVTLADLARWELDAGRVVEARRLLEPALTRLSQRTHPTVRRIRALIDGEPT